MASGCLFALSNWGWGWSYGLWVMSYGREGGSDKDTRARVSHTGVHKVDDVFPKSGHI